MLRYIPEFDGLRACAVMLVIVSHWLPDSFIINYLPCGAIGVTLFFVLSGYLITKILYNDRQKENKWKSVKLFYFRRLLRIFPIYYLVLFLITITNYNHLRQHILWFFSYLQNIYIAIVNDWPGGVGPYWTLAVEEQFYLFWPFIILFCNEKWIFRVILVFIFLSPLFRLGIYFYYSEISSVVLTPSCFDTLALGAILALKEQKIVDVVKSRINSYVGASGFFYLLWLFVINYLPEVWDAFLTRSIFSVFCFFLLSKCIIGFGGKLNTFFNNKYLIQTGKISYGIYLYHMLIFSILNNVLKHFNLFPLLNHNSKEMYFLAPVYLIILLLISYLSFVFIEKPLLKLKAYYSYS